MATRIHRSGASVVLALLLSFATVGRAESWESTVSPVVPGSFAEPRVLRARYNFGWSGFTAANADFRFEKSSDQRFHLEALGRTVGLVRALWRYDIAHVAYCDAATYRPLVVREVEKFRPKQVTTEVTFSPTGVSSTREQRKEGDVQARTLRFDFPNVQSVISALLFLRSQPLSDGAVHRVVVYPATSAYLCTIKVLGRERIKVATGNYDAIKLDVQLSKIGPQRELLPHKKFRDATVWLSNDADRLALRVEAQVFVGTVFAELQSVKFD